MSCYLRGTCLSTYRVHVFLPMGYMSFYLRGTCLSTHGVHVLLPTGYMSSLSPLLPLSLCCPSPPTEPCQTGFNTWSGFLKSVIGSSYLFFWLFFFFFHSLFLLSPSICARVCVQICECVCLWMDGGCSHTGKTLDCAVGV